MPAAVEVADDMLEHLNQLEANTSPMACFRALGLDEAVLTETESSTLSDQACVAYIRKAVVF